MKPNGFNVIYSCIDGFMGEFCQTEDPKVIQMRNGLISAAVILGIALIVAILVGIYFYRRSV